MAKTKALISFAVTAKLICVFVFAYAKIRFSNDEAQMKSVEELSSACGQLFHISSVLHTMRTVDQKSVFCVCVFFFG